MKQRAALPALVVLLWGAAAYAQSAGPAPGETVSQSYRGSQSRNVEYQKVAPIKVFDNLYYVGPGSVSVWLIPTTDGLILIDTAQEPLVDHVIDSIRKVGFDPKNIRYILLSHGHLDHFGGAAKIQALSGARVATLDEDWQLIEAAGKQAGRGGQPPPAAPKRDMVIKEGDTITLGKTQLKVYKLPGHTAGSPSFAFTVFDNGRPHKALLFGGPGQRNGVEGGTQFLNSIRRLKKEFSDVEVPVHVHSWLTTYPVPAGGTVFEPAMKLAQRKPGEPHPFVDNAGWRAWLDVAEAGTLKYVQDAKGAAASPAPAQEWTDFVSREDRFSANFPGQPAVANTTYKSQFGADLPARVYSATLGPSRFSLTVVDYRPIEKLLAEKAKSCPEGSEVCRGGFSSTGPGYSWADRAGAMIYAAWQFMQRDARVTEYIWNNVNQVVGHQMHLTNNRDKSRTLAAVYMHDDRLYIIEGTVPAGYPEPGLFQQSLGFLDSNGNPLRYDSHYVNGFPPPTINGGQVRTDPGAGGARYGGPRGRGAGPGGGQQPQ